MKQDFKIEYRPNYHVEVQQQSLLDRKLAVGLHYGNVWNRQTWLFLLTFLSVTCRCYILVGHLIFSQVFLRLFPVLICGLSVSPCTYMCLTVCSVLSLPVCLFFFSWTCSCVFLWYVSNFYLFFFISLFLMFLLICTLLLVVLRFRFCVANLYFRICTFILFTLLLFCPSLCGFVSL